MQSDWSSQQFVEALSSAGADLLLLQTLPEAVLAPLQEAMVKSQAEPPATWTKQLLDLVRREDVNMLLIPGERPRQAQSALLVSRILHIWLQLIELARPHHMKLTSTFTRSVILQLMLRVLELSTDRSKLIGKQLLA